MSAFLCIDLPALTDLHAIRELKRREKQREKEAKKAEKAAADPKPSATTAARSSAANEANLSPNVSNCYERYLYSVTKARFHVVGVSVKDNVVSVQGIVTRRSRMLHVLLSLSFVGAFPVRNLPSEDTRNSLPA